MGRGGMRYGAGRPSCKVKAEQCRHIDARRWKREGILSDGSRGTWQWTDAETGERLASIGYTVREATLVLDYRLNGAEMVQTIAVHRTACHFGGWRVWFGCPRCGRRVAVLYLRGGKGFVCRHCGSINYRSQCEDAFGRAWLRQRKAEAKLGPHWRRPKGMHNTTRRRIMAVILDCEDQRDAALMAFMQRHFPAGLTLARKGSKD